VTLGLFYKSARPEGASVMQEPAILHHNLAGLRARPSAYEAYPRSLSDAVTGNGFHARRCDHLVPALTREALWTKIVWSSP
jgi:hypothetical protein